jgi:hypothetical protein
MSTTLRKTAGGAIRTTSRAWQDGRSAAWWSAHREASLNWLALGILLAAWNASDDDSSPARRRPEALRRYTYVSVRAATLHAGELRATPTNR